MTAVTAVILHSHSQTKLFVGWAWKPVQSFGQGTRLGMLVFVVCQHSTETWLGCGHILQVLDKIGIIVSKYSRSVTKKCIPGHLFLHAFVACSTAVRLGSSSILSY